MYKVKYYDFIGWVPGSNILTKEQKEINDLKSKISDIETKTISIGYGATLKSNLPLRSAPSSSFSTVTTLGYYCGVDILEVKAGWYKVRLYDKIGWLQAADVKTLQ